MIEPAPSVSVVIATRNRPVTLSQAVASVLESDHPNFEVLVPDQSTQRLASLSRDAIPSDARVRHLPLGPDPGLSRARNVAIRESAGSIIAITDDDCVVDPDWLDQLERRFKEDRKLGVLFGNVSPATFDASAGFIPAFVSDRPETIRTPWHWRKPRGMGACMAVRRECWAELSGFDESLGAGARFRAGEDGDLALRALACGWAVGGEPGAQVVHHGFRDWAEGWGVVEAYWYGAGAAWAKGLRLRWSTGLWHLGVAFVSWAVWSSPVATSLGSDRRRWQRLRAYLRGGLAGFQAPLDRRSGHFLPIEPSQDPLGSSEVIWERAAERTGE